MTGCPAFTSCPDNGHRPRPQPLANYRPAEAAPACVFRTTAGGIAGFPASPAGLSRGRRAGRQRGRQRRAGKRARGIAAGENNEWLALAVAGNGILDRGEASSHPASRSFWGGPELNFLLVFDGAVQHNPPATRQKRQNPARLRRNPRIRAGFLTKIRYDILSTTERHHRRRPGRSRQRKK